MEQREYGCSGLDWCELHQVDHGHPVPPSELDIDAPLPELAKDAPRMAFVPPLNTAIRNDDGSYTFTVTAPVHSVPSQGIMAVIEPDDSVQRDCEVEDGATEYKEEKVCKCVSLLAGHDNDCPFAEKKE